MGNAGYDAGVSKREPIERLAWQLKGAPRRKKDAELTALPAILEGRGLMLAIASKLAKRGLDPRDVVVKLVFGERDNLEKCAGWVDFRYGAATPDADDLESYRANALHTPLGYVVLLHDKKNGRLLGHVRALLTAPAAHSCLDRALIAATDLSHERRALKGPLN